MPATPHLAHCETVANDDRCRMDLVADQLIGTLQKLGGNYDHRCRAVADLLVLQLRQLHQDLLQTCYVLSEHTTVPSAMRLVECKTERQASAGATLMNADLGRRLLDLEQPEDGGAIVCDRDIADIIHKHLVQALRPQGCFDNICNGCDGRHVL